MNRIFAAAFAFALALTQGRFAAASTPLGPDFAPKGEVRIATRTASDPINTTASFASGFVAVPGMTIPVTVPNGKVADVTILFTGEMNSPDAEYVSAVIDGGALSPGAVQAFWKNNGGATSQAATFTGIVPAGNHFIQMQWGGLGGQQFMSLRTMTVLLNLRRQ